MQCSWEMRGQVPFCFHVLPSAVYTYGEERGGEGGITVWLLRMVQEGREKKGALTLALEVVYSTLYRVLE